MTGPAVYHVNRALVAVIGYFGTILLIKEFAPQSFEAFGLRAAGVTHRQMRRYNQIESFRQASGRIRHEHGVTEVVVNCVGHRFTSLHCMAQPFQRQPNSRFDRAQWQTGLCGNFAVR